MHTKADVAVIGTDCTLSDILLYSYFHGGDILSESTVQLMFRGFHINVY